MTTTDLAIINPDIMAAQMAYAENIAKAAVLPAAYRGKPADILVAIGLGEAVGITPAQSLYEIFVVNGRPSPSANLVASLVRRAGHKVRVRGDEQSCTAQLVRDDDPDFTYEVTWTMDMARRAGLAGKDVWKHYPANMLRSRAIMDVCRAGAPEAMLGMEYSREELADIDDGAKQGEAPRSATAKARQRMAQAQTATPEPAADGEVVDAEVVEEQPADTGEQISPAQQRALFAAFRDAGFTSDARSEEGRAARLAYLAGVTGSPVASTGELTRDQASRCIDALRADATDLATTTGATE